MRACYRIEAKLRGGSSARRRFQPLTETTSAANRRLTASQRAFLPQGFCKSSRATNRSSRIRPVQFSQPLQAENETVKKPCFHCPPDGAPLTPPACKRRLGQT